VDSLLIALLGTITDEQFERLEALSFEASRHWSREEPE
jgi:hypothetical protein